MKRTLSSPPRRCPANRRPSTARRARQDVRRAEVAALFAELFEESVGRADRRPRQAGAPDSAEAAGSASPADAPRGLFIDRPVRSGQSIRFPEGDVTIIGSVSSG